MDDKLTLPTEDTVPEFDTIESLRTLLVFGPPKGGKTSFGAQFERSLLLDCEDNGAKYVRCRKLDIKGLEGLRDAYMALREDKEYSTVVIDTLDAVAHWIEAEICKEMGLRSILDSKKGEKHGSQWGAYVNRVLGFLEAWKSLGKRVIFLAHTKKAEITGDGLVINPKTIALYGQAAQRVLGTVDNIGHLFAREGGEGTKRMLSFRPGEHVEAGARHPKLANQLIELPEGKMYQAFSALFNGGKIWPESAPKAAAKPAEKIKTKKKGGK